MTHLLIHGLRNGFMTHFDRSSEGAMATMLQSAVVHAIAGSRLDSGGKMDSGKMALLAHSRWEKLPSTSSWVVLGCSRRQTVAS